MLTQLFHSCAVVIALPAAIALAQATTVKTTTYTRNADGALTAVTTQIDGGPATTVYLTWDNFQPNTGDPTTGTVSAANGNLLGYGASPGGPYATQLQFDQRNRLSAATVAGVPGVSYAYYAASRMAAATLTSNDTLQFYYDTAQNQVATNLYQQSTGTWSSCLDQATYLSDGTEQVRVQPRKDVAGQYDAAAQAFTTINYDPYGVTVDPPPPTTSYDLTQNPFQYAGELRDPTWGGYYLRARWYAPDLQTFVSRDPDDKVRRYAYANGNPIMNTDPSGLASRYTRDFGRPLEKALKPLTSGAGGYVFPLFLGTELSALSILANPGGFWHSIQHDSHGTDFFLAATIVSEVAGQGLGLSFRSKAGLGAVIGVAQAIGAGDNGARKPFNWAGFGQSLEYAANFEAEARYADEKYHFQQHNLSADTVNGAVKHFFEHTSGDPEVDSIAFTMFPKEPTGPIEEAWQQVHGPQDQYLVSISKERVRISGRNDYFTAEFSKPYDPNLTAIENIQQTPAQIFDLDFSDRSYRIAGFIEGTESNLKALRATDRGASQSAYVRTKVAGERPEPMTNARGSTSASYAARIRQRLGLLD